MNKLSAEEFLIHHYPNIEKYPKPLKNFIINTIKNFLYEDEINKFLNENINKDSFSFVDSILDYLDIGIKINTKELERIPQFGRVVIIANHPSVLDSLFLIQIIKNVRKDFKIVANSFLQNIKPLKDLLIEVDNVNESIKKSSFREMIDYLNSEHAIIIFPSGEISRPSKKSFVIKEGKWRPGFYKIASKTYSPILPIHIKAKHSLLFYALSMLNKSISTAILPREVVNFKKKQVNVKIGNLIPYESYNIQGINTDRKVKLIRKHLFKIAKNKKGIFKEEKGICLPEPVNEIKSEIKNGKLLGKTFDGKSIILYESDTENSVIKEIGRLREITFRFVGEGTGNRKDIDKYDFYYKHLIIWDEENLEIAGAYRIGVCKDILESKGISGLYTSTLFRFDEKFHKYLPKSLELGRSFVQPKYWNSKTLDYLWQGLGAYIRENPNIKYLFGPVSLSNRLTLQAKSLIVYFYKLYFSPKEKLVKHKNPFYIPKDIVEYCKYIFEGNDYKKDFLTLKRELNFLGFSVPTLYKQYTEACEREGVAFHDFGIDENFNNCVDGFIFVDLNYLKPSKKKRYLRL